MLKELAGKGFKVVSANIRSILKHKDELSILMNTVDIVALQESWLNYNVTDDLLAVKGFQYIRQDRSTYSDPAAIKQGGGLLIYMKDYLAPYTEKIEKGCICSNACEQLWVKISVPCHRITILGVIYRPPSASVNDGLSEIDSVLQDVSTCFDISRIDLIMLGDFNINYAKHTTVDTRKVKAIDRKFHLKQLIRESTRITNRSKSTIDLIFTNISHIKDSGAIDIAISDHRPVYLVKKQARNRISFVNTWRRNYKTYDRDTWCKRLEGDYKWREFWEIGDDPDALWEKMLSIFINAADELYPNVKCRSWKDRDEWVDDEVMRIVNKKRRTYRQAVQSQLDEDWRKYKAVRSEVARLLRRKKRKYIVSTLNSKKR